MTLARPRITLAAVAILAVALAYIGLRFASYDTAPDTIVDPGSAAFRNEIQFENTFGADPVVMLITTDVKALFSGPGLAPEIKTEANLATQENQQRGVQSVYGPASFATITGYAALSIELAQLQQAQQTAQTKAVNDAKAAGKSDPDAQAAGTKAATDAGNAFLTDQQKAHPELAQIGIPGADNPAWMAALYINPDTGATKPKFSSFVPDGQHLLVTARLNPSTGESQVNAIGASVRQTLKDSPIPNARVTISGVPVLQNAVTQGLRVALRLGMALGATSMLVLLVVALRRRTRLLARFLPIASGLLTVALLGGIVSGMGQLVGRLRGLDTFAQPAWQTVLATFTLALNPATLAAFPIALGLAVDYGVQFLYRYTQAGDDPKLALDAARQGAGRATFRAAICTVAGLMALMLSSIPMVRQFGIAMIIGAVLAWGVARVVTLAALKSWPWLGQQPVRATVEAEPDAPVVETAPAPAAARASTPPPEDDDVALFGLGAVSAAVAETPAQVEAGGEGPARGEWRPVAWTGAAIVIMEAQRPAPARRRVVAATIEAVRVSAPVPTPAAPAPDWERRWEEVGTDVEDDDEDSPPADPGRIPAALVAFARRRTVMVLVPALVLALVGWIAFPFASYQTDPEKLLSPNLPAFKDLDAVRQATGSSGELDFILSGPDVTSPDALKWVTDLQTKVETTSQGKIRPVTSLAKLLTDINGGQQVNEEQEKAFLGILPPYVTNSLVGPQRHLARVAFGLSPGPIEDQRKVVDQVLREVQAPNGYSYYAAGFTYLGITGLDSLQGSQVILNVAGAALVLVALFAIYRRPRMALMAWAPTLLVAGWSTAVLFVLRQPLTPMTGVLGALVVAFGTEFAILWLERYREAVADGVPAGAGAAEAASRAAGPGIMLSGAALTLGFLALTLGAFPGLSALGFDLPMVRDFGLVAAMDMVLAVVAALLVLPALVVRFGLAEDVPAPRREKRAAAAEADARA